MERNEQISVNTDEQQEKPELSAHEKRELFELAVENGIQIALQVIAERFENTPEAHERLEYHNLRHTKDVLRRFDTILNLVRDHAPHLYSEHSHHVGRFGAAHHDTVQKWVRNSISDPDGLTKVLRKRLVGKNEAESTAEAIELMNRLNQESGTEIFTQEDKSLIAEAHEATVPSFDLVRHTVVQPNLTESSSVITRAIALADLGTAGMDGPEAFLSEGDALFREENIDIGDALTHPELLTETERNFFRKRMLDWTHVHGAFAAGRKELLESEVAPFPEELRNEVKHIFANFDDSIRAAEAQFERRTHLSFADLARDMGYTIAVSEVS